MLQSLYQNARKKIFKKKLQKKYKNISNCILK